MKIALIGYGKMGKTIESIAIERGHEIVLKIDVTNAGDLNTENLQKADVAIEFTNPESAIGNLYQCFDAGVPVVCGSTGWLAKMPEVQAYRLKTDTGLLQSSNFSLGVNIFMEVNKVLARYMSNQPSYNLSVTEIHHTAKLDAPSGTAISLAEQILDNYPAKKEWIKADSATKYTAKDIPIFSDRIDPAPGTHIIKYSSEIDDIEIIHTAHNRHGFALGAVIAAEFLNGKKGNYTMQDVLAL
ncbi:4-hydroxy-tetrahydrodipicolinate reductase [Polluticaenibacter yanchengensis]|uniref:4-hydroxy-tetrahydrodipicolinate reductase n=1 Tax=Polluticaenibacter yanchengensis TaxID=3014562 RepID=A0ABT4UNY8_9BACT|nr:4-hydroxy-tetrahydrodipicolinate reductase [Chitinophagaceae bacterium LY-5]